MARISRRIRDWFRAQPGLPTTLLGAADAAYGLVHVWQTDTMLVIDWLVVDWTSCWPSPWSTRARGCRVVPIPTWTACRCSGGGRLRGHRFRGRCGAHRVPARARRPIQAIPFVLLAASGTTAAIGVALALYHVDLRAERANLADQHETVAELNKRLTVLHRVNRHNLGNELTVVRGHIDLFLEGTPTRRLNARSRPFTSTSAGSGP